MNKSYNNLNIKNLIRTDFLNQFDEYQQREILEGAKNNLEISIYAKKYFNEFQMKQIRLGLLHNVNVFIYAKPEFSYEKMRKIRNELEENHSYLGL